MDLAAKRDGTVLGLKLRLIADIGAYNMLLTAAIPTLTMMMANATYNIPAIRTTLTEVFTNKTPTDAYRGAGRPEATYFVERAMDMLARELKMDPAELRRKNFIQPNQFPFATQMGAVYDSGDYEKALDLALKTAKWERLKAERDAARAQGRLVGLGLSMYVEVCGLGPSSSLPTGGWEHSQVTIERDGRISATTGASPHGQGNETTFAQMLADQFGVPIEHITILHGDTGVVKQGIGTFGSRSQAVGGRCNGVWWAVDVRGGLRSRAVGVAADRRLGAFAGHDRTRRPDQRHDRRVAARPGQRDDVRADARGSIRRADGAHQDPARRHRRREAGHRHVREPVAGGRRNRAAPGRRQGEDEDGEVRRRDARGARGRSRVRERHDLA